LIAMREPPSLTDVEQSQPPERKPAGRPSYGWPFHLLERGYAATFNRACSSVRRAMYRYKATPEGEGSRIDELLPHRWSPPPG